MTRPEPAHISGRRFDWLGGLSWSFTCLFLYIPSLMLPIFSFNDSIQMVLPLKEFTLKWYVALAEQPRILAALGNSLKGRHFRLHRTTTILATF